MASFVVANVLAALSPNLHLLAVGRLMAGFSHGVFFTIAATMATTLVPPSRSALAVSQVFAGLTVAMVIGVPLGTAIGQSFGWRVPFAVVAALGCVALAAMLMTLPPTVLDPHRVPLSAHLALLRNRRFWGLYFLSAVGFGGSFVFLAFLTPFMADIALLPRSDSGVALATFGVAAVVGNVAGGNLASRVGRRCAVRVTVAAVVATLAAMPLSARHEVFFVCNLFAWGVALFSVAPIAQAAVIDTATRNFPDSVHTASGLNIAAFNFGIVAASSLGTRLIVGPGLWTVPIAAAAVTSLALFVETD